MKKYTIIALALGMIFNGCSKDNVETKSKTIENPIQFIANVDESGDSKTALQSDGSSIYWNTGDEVKIFGTISGAANFGGYKVKTAGATSDLEYVSGHGSQFSTEDVPSYAIYPYEAGVSIDGSTITFTLPSEQTYVENSFANGANVAVGAVKKTDLTGTNTISFKNVCSYLKLQLSGTASIGKIVLTAKGDVKISGTCTVDASSSTPEATCTGGNTITLNCGSIALSTDAANPTAFIFVVPVGTFGFTAEIYSAQGHLIKTLDTKTNTVVCNRAKVRPIKNQDVPKLLPDGYTEMAYIQSDGTNYINTGVQVSANGYRMECSIAITGGAPGNNPSLFGGVYNDYPTLYKFVSFDNRTGGNHMRALYNSHAKDDDNLTAVYEGANTWNFVNNQIYHLDVCLIKGIQSLKIDGKDLTLNTFNEDVHTNTQNVEVFFLANNEKNKNSQTYVANKFYPTRVYFCNMYNGSNTLVRRFIPAYNGTLYGFYDLANSAFYTSAGGNAFGGGNL